MNPIAPEQLLTKLQNGVTSSEEVTRQYCEALQSYSHLNALCVFLPDEALLAAKQRDKQFANSGTPGPLHGLPVTIKECFDLTGTASTFGLTHRKNDIARSNDIYVEALLEAGAVVPGKTNVAQLLSFIESDNPLYGVTKHPKFPVYSCGGSSGGEGALVGAGLSPLGLGTDIGGSIRVPSAVNGACGIKPTGERFPDKCHLFPEQEQLPIKSAVGPISQDAFTLHTAISVMQQKIETQWEVKPLLDYRNINIAKLKIGYFSYDGIFPVSKPCKDAVQKAVSTLRDAGAQLIEYRFPDLAEAEALFYGGMSIENGRYLLNCLGNDRPVPNLRDLCRAAPLSAPVKKLLTTILGIAGQKHESRILNLISRYSMADIPGLTAMMEQYKAKIIRSMDHTTIGKLDAVLSPVLPVPAYRLNSFKSMGLAGSYCLVNNITGFPAGTACVGTVTSNPICDEFSRIDFAERRAQACTESAAGLPLSVQITAKPWREDIVLALIEKLHQPFSQSIYNDSVEI